MLTESWRAVAGDGRATGTCSVPRPASWRATILPISQPSCGRSGRRRRNRKEATKNPELLSVQPALLILRCFFPIPASPSAPAGRGRARRFRCHREDLSKAESRCRCQRCADSLRSIRRGQRGLAPTTLNWGQCSVVDDKMDDVLRARRSAVRPMVAAPRRISVRRVGVVTHADRMSCSLLSARTDLVK